MCGVFGFAGNLTQRQWGLAHSLLVELAVASEERGRDAAGFAALTSRGELICHRQPGPARELFSGPEFAALRRRKVTMVVGHARLATSGAPARNGNNHPHLAGEWALVHNGIIRDHQRLAAIIGVRLQSECDSEILVHLLARHGEKQGPEVCFALGGKQSVLAIGSKSKVMLAWTNGEMPLVVFRASGLPAVFWASTGEIAARAAQELGLGIKFAHAEPGVVYRLEVRDKVMVTKKTARESAGKRRFSEE